MINILLTLLFGEKWGKDHLSIDASFANELVMSKFAAFVYKSFNKRTDYTIYLSELM